MEDIQLVKDSQVSKRIPTIIRQANHKDEDFDVNSKESEQQAKNNNEQWIEQQYSTPDLIILEIFIANSIRIPIESQQLSSFSIDSLKFEVVATQIKVLQLVFYESILSCIIEPAILDQLEKQQNDRFYYFNQYQIPSKLQTAFIVSNKVHKQNFLLESSNYQQLNPYTFKK